MQTKGSGTWNFLFITISHIAAKTPVDIRVFEYFNYMPEFRSSRSKTPLIEISVNIIQSVG